jgi:integrase
MTVSGNGSNRVKLTRRVVEAFIHGHDGKRKDRLWDTEVKNFYLQVTPAGAASYCIRYTRWDGGKSDFTIGSAKVIALEDARRKALEKLAALALEGTDPVAQRKLDRENAKKAKQDTFAWLVERFDEAISHADYKDKRFRRYTFNKYILPALGKMSLHDITISDVKALVRSVREQVRTNERAKARGDEGFVMANGVQALVRRVYSWANDAEITERNPGRFKKLFDDTPEKRIARFSDEKFRAVWSFYEEKACRSVRSDAALIVLIFFVTLQRPVDVSRARRDEVDLDRALWVVSKERTKKKKKAYYVPLSPLAVALFRIAMSRHEGEYVFASKSWRGHFNEDAVSCHFTVAVKEMVRQGRLPDTDLELYDGRRFGRTRIEIDLGWGEKVAELVINHYDGGMNSKYNEHDYKPEIREAQNAWSSEIVRILGREPLLRGMREGRFG